MHFFFFQTPSLSLWCEGACWGASGRLRTQPPACPGAEPIIVPSIGSTSTSREAALTCWPHLLTAHGRCTSVQSVTGEKTAVRCETWQGRLTRIIFHCHNVAAPDRYAVEYIFFNVCGPSFQALKMMLGLDLVSVHHRNLTLNNRPVPTGEPLFQNGKLFSSVITYLDLASFSNWICTCSYAHLLNEGY